MADKYKFKITKTFHYYGYPQAHYKYSIEGDYIEGTIDYYGNQGFDMPKLQEKGSRRGTNGYFWSMHHFMKDLYSDYGVIEKAMRNLREDESTEVEV